MNHETLLQITAEMPCKTIEVNGALDQRLVREMLHYDLETGVFTWINHPSLSHRRRFAGKRAGRIDSRGYLQIMVLGTRYLAHRLAFLYVHGSLPSEGMEVDHIDGNRKNNAWNNLRVVTKAENAKNQKRRCTNLSGVTGVSWYKPYQKWVAHIQVNGKPKHLGYFVSKRDAVEARQRASIAENFHENHGR